jgi:hypothetical protein
LKLSKKQLRKLILENIFSDAYEYMFGSEDDSEKGVSEENAYTPGQVVTTSKGDPYEYKEEKNTWVYRKKDSSDSWKNMNKAGSENLTREFKKTSVTSKTTNSSNSPDSQGPPASYFDVEDEDMFTAIDDQGNHYRILTTGRIYRFGVTRRGRFVMDDPSIEITAPKDKQIAQNLLDQEGLSSSVIDILKNILEDNASNDNPLDAATTSLIKLLRRSAQSLGTKIHLVAFLDYLLGRTQTFTENDLNSTYKRDLAKVAAIAAVTNRGKILGSNSFVYNDFWVKASKALGQGTPTTPLSSNPGPSGTGTVEDLMYFLGGMTVKKTGDNYVITDIYDFDDYFSNPRAFDEFSDFVDDISSDALYKKVRRIAAWRQSSGYGGYRVEITLPKSLAEEEDSSTLSKTISDFAKKYGLS